MSDTNCPYCGSEVEICHDDGYGYEEDEIHHEYCSDCDKYFAYRTTIVFYYDAEKADCLNSEEDIHSWEPRYKGKIHRSMAEMECTVCGERRKCTDQEMSTMRFYE